MTSFERGMRVQRGFGISGLALAIKEEIDAAVVEAVAAEREACANLVNQYAVDYMELDRCAIAANAIRARGAK
jgi:hypothetical protein